MTKVSSSTNIPTVTIGRLEKLLFNILCNAIKSGKKLSMLPSVILWGIMGVGKSDGVKQLADELRRKTGKKVNLIDIRLLLFSPVDLRGLPTVNQDKTSSVWLIPNVFKLDSSEDVINIIFLDEISACTPSVQAAAYQIVLDHKVGEHALPENTFVIAAGNRTCDKSVAYKMPKALANRLCHFEITASVDEWSDWAIKHNIDYRIIGYLRFQNDRLLMPEVEDDDLAFPTPRSWEMASKYIELCNGDIDAAYNFICGCVGVVVTMGFFAYCKTYINLPDIKKIFSGEVTNIPCKAPDICHALVSSMIGYVREHKDDYPKIEKSIEFATDNLPVDFVTLLVQGYVSVDVGIKPVINNMQAYKNYIIRKGRMLNGLI